MIFYVHSVQNNGFLTVDTLNSKLSLYHDEQITSNYVVFLRLNDQLKSVLITFRVITSVILSSSTGCTLILHCIRQVIPLSCFLISSNDTIFNCKHIISKRSTAVSGTCRY